MDDTPFFSSQGTQYDHHNPPTELDQENIVSSPLRARTTGYRSNNGRVKKAPTVTPKRFNKFFMPRDTASSRRNKQSKAGRQLQDITRDAVNRRRTTGDLNFQSISQENGDDGNSRPAKRRKHSVDIPSSPPPSSPLGHVRKQPSIDVYEDNLVSPTISAVSDADTELPALLEDLDPFPKPIQRLRGTGQARRILERSFGGFHATSRGWQGSDHCADWRSETANFYTAPSDTHAYNPHKALPFCAASCNTNSLVAIGDEQGNVRMVDSAASADFKETHVTFKPHRNAIMDIAMSSDDMLLATSSGDQTARIVDMPTQRCKFVLTGHTASAKQVRFWPNDNNLITTSARDGSVQIWDLRCSAKGAAQSSIHPSNYTSDRHFTQTLYSKDTLRVGHAFKGSRLSFMGAQARPDDALEISITSIQHMGQGREHLLATASETHASIKLWDLRNAGRRGTATPVSSTLVPEAHKTTRDFGIGAVAMSHDGARLYATCRDSTVYAYSASHLILGCAPEMSAISTARRQTRRSTTGLGPLYGFRHPQLRANSFYIKMAMRKAQGDKGEMLAVGSTDSNPVLIPTDERYLPRYRESLQRDMDVEEYDDLPTVASALPKPAVPAMPVYDTATPLIRAHKREVTSVAWTHDGELVSVGDDFTVRCWREDQGLARNLRGCGEGGGARWGYGWADVEASWDEDDY